MTSYGIDYRTLVEKKKEVARRFRESECVRERATKREAGCVHPPSRRCFIRTGLPDFKRAKSPFVGTHIRALVDGGESFGRGPCSLGVGERLWIGLDQIGVRFEFPPKVE